MEHLYNFARELVRLYSKNRISQAAAALAYYLTMTLFPLIIVVYALLERSRERLLLLLKYSENILSPAVQDFISSYMDYIEQSDNRLMLSIGFLVLLSYASASIRSMHGTIGCIQGGAEYSGLPAYFASILFSLGLLAVIYLAIIAMLFLSGFLYVRYLILWALALLFNIGLYHVPKRHEDKYSVIPGAVFSSLGIILISPAFSFVMGRSMKYSLVYGSLSAFILLMLWLYMCSLIVYIGAVLNVSLYKGKKPQDH